MAEMTEFPTGFQSYIQPLLQNEWTDFLLSLNASPTRSIRLHRLTNASASYISANPNQKNQVPTSTSLLWDVSPLQEQLDALLEQPVPWTTDAFYISTDSILGKTVYHETGAFYIQEPSAQAVVSALEPLAGERILDLCAAPGGKASAIGRILKGNGQLVANEIHPTRVITLAENLERLGIPALITQETPERLANAWPSEFDAIVVDAPCSGEGMFRKDKESRLQWSIDTPVQCAIRQKQILQHAVRMLRKGGRLIYSTCTFNALENEQIIAWLVEQFGMQVVPLPLWDGWSEGEPSAAKEAEYLRHTRRLWPHRGKGEGHFVAKLIFSEDVPSVPSQMHHSSRPSKSSSIKRKKLSDPIIPWHSWLRPTMHPFIETMWGKTIRHKNTIFSDELNQLTHHGLKVLRPGLPLATVTDSRILPHHALAMSLHQNAASHIELLSETAAIQYLNGDALSHRDQQGYCHLQFQGLPLGWGKMAPGRINNLYPKGLRKPHIQPLDS